LDRLSLHNNQDLDPEIQIPNLQAYCFQQTASQPCPILDSSDAPAPDEIQRDAEMGYVALKSQ
jgi:uncharacterized protein YcsI (UPF0317 family)